AVEVDPLDGAGVEMRLGAEPPNRGDRVEQADASRDHLRQHRLEGEVVLPAHERDLDVVLAPEQLLERRGRVDPPEAPADDKHARRTRRHIRTIPPTKPGVRRSPPRISPEIRGDSTLRSPALA